MKTLRILLFGLGLLLLLINVFGLLKSMRHNDLYTEENTGRLNDVTIKLKDAKKQLVRRDGESDKEFSLRVNDVVCKSMSHYFKNEGKKKYNLRSNRDIKGRPVGLPVIYGRQGPFSGIH